MPVLLLRDTDPVRLAGLLARFGIETIQLPPESAIPGSYWGDSEAGLIANKLYVRPDTPVHSALHEACHFVCMDDTRRTDLERDAGGDYDEENAVCYLQIVLADAIEDFGRERMWSDMDAWGYTFRLGSAQAWFERDADDARHWLTEHGLIDGDVWPTWKCRGLEVMGVTRVTRVVTSEK